MVMTCLSRSLGFVKNPMVRGEVERSLRSVCFGSHGIVCKQGSRVTPSHSKQCHARWKPPLWNHNCWGQRAGQQPGQQQELETPRKGGESLNVLLGHGAHKDSGASSLPQRLCDGVQCNVFVRHSPWGLLHAQRANTCKLVWRHSTANSAMQWQLQRQGQLLPSAGLPFSTLLNPS